MIHLLIFGSLAIVTRKRISLARVRKKKLVDARRRLVKSPLGKRDTTIIKGPPYPDCRGGNILLYSNEMAGMDPGRQTHRDESTAAITLCQFGVGCPPAGCLYSTFRWEVTIDQSPIDSIQSGPNGKLQFPLYELLLGSYGP